MFFLDTEFRGGGVVVDKLTNGKEYRGVTCIFMTN